VASVTADALSGVLALNLSAALLRNVSSTVTQLTSGVQRQLSVGETAANFTTSNARISAVVVDPSTLSSGAFQPPVTDAEVFNGKKANSLAMSVTTPPDALGVSVFSYSNNPSKSKDDTTPVALKTSR
jgi:hypothetical protein